MKNKDVVEHHIKYKELHGIDETVWLTQSEHKLLHNRLRKEGKCNISADELRKISKVAYVRTEKAKKYENSEHRKNLHHEYEKGNRKSIDFFETIGRHIGFHEIVKYNQKTGTVNYNAWFAGNNGYVIPVVYI